MHKALCQSAKSSASAFLPSSSAHPSRCRTIDALVFTQPRRAGHAGRHRDGSPDPHPGRVGPWRRSIAADSSCIMAGRPAELVESVEQAETCSASRVRSAGMSGSPNSCSAVASQTQPTNKAPSTPRPRSSSSAPASVSNPSAGPGVLGRRRGIHLVHPQEPRSTTGTAGPPEPKHDSPSAAGAKNGTTVAATTRRWP